MDNTVIGGYRSSSLKLSAQSDYPQNVLMCNILGAYADNGEHVAIVGSNSSPDLKTRYVWLNGLNKTYTLVVEYLYYG